jgi:hypothetical protein
MILRRLVVIAFSATVGLGFALHEQPLARTTPLISPSRRTGFADAMMRRAAPRRACRPCRTAKP